MIPVLEPSNIIPSGSWGNDLGFRVTDPSHGGWFCFNLEVSYFGGAHVRVYENLEDTSTMAKRIWHLLARRSRRKRCRRASKAN